MNNVTNIPYIQYLLVVTLDAAIVTALPPAFAEIFMPFVADTAIDCR